MKFKFQTIFGPSKFVILLTILTFTSADFSGGNSECNECRASSVCIPDLTVRDQPAAPIPVPVPVVRYEVKWNPVEVPVKTFDAQEIRVPKTVQLLEEKCRVDATYTEKPVHKVIKVPRVVTNIVYHVVNRTKIRTVYKKRAKSVPCSVRRQVVAPKVHHKPTQAMKTKIIEHKSLKGVPTRVYTDIECKYQKTDFPIRIPTVEFKFCEDLVDVWLNSTCDTTTTPSPLHGYLPPVHPKLKRATPTQLTKREAA